jgi:hypothetical protein
VHTTVQVPEVESAAIEPLYEYVCEVKNIKIIEVHKVYFSDVSRTPVPRNFMSHSLDLVNTGVNLCFHYIFFVPCLVYVSMLLDRYRDSLRAGWSEILIPVGARISECVLSISYTMATGYLSQGYRAHGVELTIHHNLVLRLRKHIWTPLCTCVACSRANLTFYAYLYVGKYRRKKTH